jgi:hypothetical protein
VSTGWQQKEEDRKEKVATKMSPLLDGLRAVLGRLLLWALRYFKQAAIPSSDVLLADNTAVIAATIQAAMDATDANGRRQGWRAGKEALDAAREQGKLLFEYPEWLLITVLLGLPGEKTPRTSAAAQAVINSLKQQYRESGRPDYLFSQVVQTATQQLQTTDEAGNWLTAGVLKKMFEARSVSSPPLGWRTREAAVLMVFRQNPTYHKFLSVEKDGSLSLPRGKSYEEFAAAMLANAYGPYPF